jgi:cell division protein YceG involved in septum cleavage
LLDNRVNIKTPNQKYKTIAIFVAVIFAILLVIGGLLFWASQIVKVPNSKDSSEVQFVIEKGESLFSI